LLREAKPSARESKWQLLNSLPITTRSWRRYLLRLRQFAFLKPSLIRSNSFNGGDRKACFASQKPNTICASAASGRTTELGQTERIFTWKANTLKLIRRGCWCKRARPILSEISRPSCAGNSSHVKFESCTAAAARTELEPVPWSRFGTPVLPVTSIRQR